mgnify:CR=1 FL=1
MELDLTNKEILLMGYGSGDAAEVIPARIVPDWQSATAKIDMAGAMANPIDLSKEQYIRLREGHDDVIPGLEAKQEIIVDRIGTDDRQDHLSGRR